MSSKSFIEIQLEKDFKIGGFPEGLSNLSEIILEKRDEKTKSHVLKIDISSDWFDISGLSYLALQLRHATKYFNEVQLNFIKLSSNKKKMEFLWKIGFWQTILTDLDEINLRCNPDPWSYAPKNFKDRLNYTSFNLQDLIYRENSELKDYKAVKMMIDSWNTELSSTKLFKFIENSDLIQSREYLYLLLWELVQNSHDHSKGRLVTICGQIFLSTADLTKLDSDRYLFNDIKKQYMSEISNSVLKNKKEWLLRNENISFIVISCADDGIGIPASIRHKGYSVLPSDIDVFKEAFTTDIVKEENPDLFDVHGLSQVKRLVDDYDGYLYVESGQGILEISQGQIFGSSTQSNFNGTIFQIYLPIKDCTYKIEWRSKIIENSEYIKKEKIYIQEDTIVLFNELESSGVNELKNPENWPKLIKPIITKAKNIEHDPIYIDFICMPRNRQFISYFLRTIRKHLLLKGLVIINASPELMGIIRSLARIEDPINISEDIKNIVEIDKDISTVLTRGDEDFCLPLLVPFLANNFENDTSLIYWIGTLGINKTLRVEIVNGLDILSNADSKISWFELWDKSIKGDIYKTKFDFYINNFKGLCRCNPSLFEYDDDGCKLKLTHGDLFLKSYHSMKSEFETRILPKAKHNKGIGREHYLYDLAWHKNENRFRFNYYQTWEILKSDKIIDFCSKLMIKKAYLELGENLMSINAVVSVTPSAGLLGRKISKIFEINFWESPSLYDIDSPEWLPDFKNESVLIVTDVIDTTSLTTKLLKRIEISNGRCLAILSLIQNIDNLSTRNIFEFQPVIAVSNVSLGKPTEEEVNHALNNENYFEIDFHTLEPIPLDSYKKSNIKQTKNKFEKLNRRLHIIQDMIFSGHFIHNLHHYNIYFSLAHAMGNPTIKEKLISWVKRNVIDFANSNKSNKISIIYPYYSPIFILIDALRAESFGELYLEFIIALPQQKSGDRIGYKLDTQERGEYNYSVFIDDGIASGGTFSSIVEQLIENKAKAILTLILFDRIGLQPRKHLQYVSNYNYDGENVDFSFKSFFSANLKTYYRSNCPECQIIKNIESLSRYSGMVSNSIDEIKNIVKPQLISFTKSNIESRLVTKDLIGVISFNDAIYSDLPSTRELVKSLNSYSKSKTTKLDNLTKILIDKKLNRQFVNKEFCMILIKECLESETVESSIKARFLLYIQLWINKRLAFEVLKTNIPMIFKNLTVSSYGDRGKIDDYFDYHQNEFLAYATSLHTVYFQTKSEFRDQVPLGIEGFDELLEAFNRQRKYGSLYLYELSILLAEPNCQPIEQANLLIANFLGSYGGHPESLFQRLKIFFIRINSGFKFQSEFTFFRSHFLVLIEAISSTQNLFFLDDFKQQFLSELVEKFTYFEQNGDASQLIPLLKNNLISSNPTAYPPLIVSVLKKISPCFMAVIEECVRSFNEKIPDIKNITIINECHDKTFVVCQREFLKDTISNLLDNSTKNVHNNGNNDLEISLILKYSDHGIKINLEVIDNNSVSEEVIKTSFDKHGGLYAQRSQIRKWGGDIEGERVNDKTCYILKLTRSFRKGI